MGKKHATAFKCLCFTILLLFGMPKMNIKLGSVPIYIIDVLILLTVYYARKFPKIPYRIPYKNLVIFILCMMLICEFLNGLMIGTLIQPIYLMVRTCLAVNLFFLVPRIIRKPEDLTGLLKYALVGAFITSLLLISSSLPMTRGVSLILLSNPFLTPNAVMLASNILEAGEVGIRGSSLIGVSILSGAFLNVIWPLLFLLLTFYKPEGFLKYLLFATLGFVPIAVIMTYSRGAILALSLVAICIIMLHKGRYRFIIVGLLVIGNIGFRTIGMDSELFMFDRIERRTLAAIESPYDDERESERIQAYVEPFGHLLRNPSYLFLGEGFARSKVNDTPDLSGGINRADHAVFAKAYYAYGLLTSLSIIVLFLSLVNYTFRLMRKTPNNKLFSSKYTRILFVVLIGFSSWFTFGHAAVSTPRGAMLMFFVYGLVALQPYFYQWEGSK